MRLGERLRQVADTVKNFGLPDASMGASSNRSKPTVSRQQLNLSSLDKGNPHLISHQAAAERFLRPPTKV
ncbi:MAG: hypothetical protein ABH816_01980 [Candidatus Levyibacteriota bacterium]